MVTPPYLSSVTGPLSSYAHLHFALALALGGRYCEQCHLKYVENEAQRCNDTCPRPHSQDMVELGLNPGLQGPARNHPRWGSRLTLSALLPLNERLAVEAPLTPGQREHVWLLGVGPRLPSTGCVHPPSLQLAWLAP